MCSCTFDAGIEPRWVRPLWVSGRGLEVNGRVLVHISDEDRAQWVELQNIRYVEIWSGTIDQEELIYRACYFDLTTI
jgi:hypothetical protein